MFYCLDNTSFKVATAEGELTNISKCVVEDDRYHVNGALVVAPDIFVKHQAGLLKKLVTECGEHAVYILCPMPRYVTFRCCDDPNHCTNFSDPTYLASILTYLKKVKQILEKEIPEAMVIDTLELIMENSPKDLQAKEDIIRSCWSSDPVHANLHTYFKLAGNFIDLYITNKPEQKTGSGSKRSRSESVVIQQSGDRRADGSSPAAKRRNPTGPGYQNREDFGGTGGYRSGRDYNHDAGRFQTPDPRSGNYRPQNSGYIDQREHRSGQREDNRRGGFQRGRFPGYRGRRAAGGRPYYH